ncbi:MAG: Holliday junction resolvase RuvX [Clostridia bacterium]|nr:Holliday junction resolvase RuvX [Clostridia bacterium]
MIILAVDYGDVRTGIAVCDKTELLASPVTVINETDREALIKKIADIATERKAERIVVGLPVNMDGSHGARAEACEVLAKDLTELCGIETVMRDERLTTVSAHHALNATNTRGKKRKAVVDAVSAVMILQDYIDYRRLNGLS